jgi:hypothetical protein
MLVLAFPELSDYPRSVVLTTISLGRIPRMAAFSGRTGRPLNQPPTAAPLAFAPGQTMEIRLAGYIEQIRHTVEDYRPLPGLTSVIFRLRSFMFEDGMKWDSGMYSLPDTQYPGRWKPIADPRYFPGDEHENWPPNWSTRSRAKGERQR